LLHLAVPGVSAPATLWIHPPVKGCRVIRFATDKSRVWGLFGSPVDCFLVSPVRPRPAGEAALRERLPSRSLVKV